MAERQNNDKRRILITYCSDNCHALRVQMDPFEDNPGTYCDRNGKYVKIDEKECAKCNHPILYGIPRQEALERISKAFNSVVTIISPEACIEGAEAALNALLEI